VHHLPLRVSQRRRRQQQHGRRGHQRHAHPALRPPCSLAQLSGPQTGARRNRTAAAASEVACPLRRQWPLRTPYMARDWGAGRQGRR
jgi:hypothetical protein